MKHEWSEVLKIMIYEFMKIMTKLRNEIKTLHEARSNKSNQIKLIDEEKTHYLLTTETQLEKFTITTFEIIIISIHSTYKRQV